MKNRPNKSAALANSPTPPGDWRQWVFRVLAVVALPAVLVALLEVALKIAGYGYPTAFLLPVSRDGRQVFEQNNRFGWRFFGPQLARLPNPISISRLKPANTERIFVFGESAAKGDPRPQFGLSRMLEAMLSLRHPGIRFEVVNTGMTAIDSHVILPIARDCAGADGDIWVIYMGNNEVVGPFGAGTVFERQTPPLPLIRTTLALKTTRTGQWLESMGQWIRKPPVEKGEWHGMEMFLDQQVRADDPSMAVVYHHFERNLADIIRAGQRCGAGIVVSTVAVNLRDCAPFASEHRPGLSEPEKEKWENIYQLGCKAADAGKNTEAADFFHQAAQLDDNFADLRFREGQCALSLGRAPEAREQFRAARDLDTLRFRCDSRLNELARQAALNRPTERVLLADAEGTFAGQSADGLPGNDLFYEHVHLTFEGNYLLARTIGAQVEKLLPEPTAASAGAARPWPSAAECARRLGWTDWDRLAALREILARLSEAPFTRELNHDAQMMFLRAEAAKLAPATQPAGIREARDICEEALGSAPNDPPLLSQLAALKQAGGDLAGAAAAARRELELLPSDSDGWRQLGVILALEHQGAEAAEALRRASKLDPEDARLLYNRARILEEMDRSDEAILEYRDALALQPHFSLAWIGLGEAFEKMGRRDEAKDYFRKALANHVYRGESADLARFCQTRGWFEAARTNFDEAIRQKPMDAELQFDAGNNLGRAGRYAEAADHFGEAARLAPEWEPAHFFYGAALGQEGNASEAAEQFHAALRLMPDHVEARLNLGVALIKLGRYSEAQGEFEETLRQSPTNALARKYLQGLLAEPKKGN